MRATTARASPVPYSERAHTFRTAVGDFPAARARSGSPSLVGLNVNSPVPAGFVAELRTQHSPARIQDGLRHLGFRELGRADIADDDQGVFADKPRRRLVKLMFARISDLGVDRADAAFVSGPLRNGKRGLVFAIVAKRRDGRAVAHRGERLKPQVDANAAGTGRQIVRDFALENDIPSPPRVLREAAGFEAIKRDFASMPEPESALKVGHLRPGNLHGARNKRHPSERTLWTEAGAEARAALMQIARRGELAADRLDSIRVQPEQRTAARAELYQVVSAWPTDRQASLPAPLGFALRGNAEVPNLVTGAGMPGKVLAGCRILDTVFIADDQGLSTFPMGINYASDHVRYRDSKALCFCSQIINLWQSERNHLLVHRAHGNYVRTNLTNVNRRKKVRRSLRGGKNSGRRNYV